MLTHTNSMSNLGIDASRQPLCPQLAQALLVHLQREFQTPRLGFAAPPVLIQPDTGENLIAAFELSGGPPELSGPLILRRYPPARDARGILCERAIHESLLARGYPVPRVVYGSSDPEPIGGAFLLIERLASRPLLSELERLEQILSSPSVLARELPALTRLALGRVPRELAGYMLALHELDAAPIRAAVEEAGFAPEHFTVPGRLVQLDERARGAGLEGLHAAIDWLHSTAPVQVDPVLCHGDFHFLNVIIDGDRTTGIIDWSPEHLCFADREFDAGNTAVLLRLRLPGLPRATRPLVGAIQAGMERRFLANYAHDHPLDLSRVRWSGTYRLVREMVSAGEALLAGARTARGFVALDDNVWLIPEVRQSTLAAIQGATGLRSWLPDL